MPRRYRKKKYKRKDGFRSGLEQVIAKKIPSGVTWSFESERVSYLLPKTYVPDFIVVKPDGSKMYIEAKGYLRYEDQQKMRAVKFSNPHLDIRFVFPEDKAVHTSKMLNSEWCRKYGFPFAFGSIPKKWFR